MASQRQIDVNRRNAQKSTGPKTPEGKAAVSQNALKHGLTAKQAALSGEDQEEFEATRRSFEDELEFVGPLQNLLAQQIVMAAWRLGRLRLIEGGFLQLRDVDDTRDIERDCQNLPPRTRLAYLYLRHVHGPNALATLGRYEARIERSFYHALHELRRLQSSPHNNLTKQNTHEVLVLTPEYENALDPEFCPEVVSAKSPPSHCASKICVLPRS